MKPIDEKHLEDLLSQPPDYLVEKAHQFAGDTILLGAGGKMGPSLARMLVRARDSANESFSVTAVSRFGNAAVRESFERAGIRTIAGDLLSEGFVASLPDALNVIHMTGMKFGTGSNAPATWAMNTFLPSLVCRRYRGSRIAAFSTGNVYPLVNVAGPWSHERDGPDPVGEYGMSALGRERIFQYFCERDSIPTSLIRLNYAVEMRYGVLVDIACRVFNKQEIDLSMGYANVIWQGDANAMAIASLADADTPANLVNVAGPELVVVADVANRFGELFGMEPILVGQPAATALLNDGSLGHKIYGKPRILLEQLIDWTADWIRENKPLLGKPTHFEVRSGKF